MSQPHRVAIIEVGGRAVRLLVADVVAPATLNNILTASREVDLATAATPAETDARIAEVATVLTSFISQAEAQRPVRVAAFGTGAIRRLGARVLPPLRGICPDFHVLSKKEEAEFSFLAAMLATGTPRGAASLVVDQGSTSMEVVIGVMGPRGPDIQAYRSYSLGTRELVKMLHRSGDFGQFRKTLGTRLRRYRSIAIPATGRPIVLGSAATNLAWLSVRPELLAQYDPRRVQGKILRLNHIDSLVQVAEADREAARFVMQPGKPNDAEFETVICGLIALAEFLRKESKNEFVVCGNGTRYGLAWKLACGNSGMQLGCS